MKTELGKKLPFPKATSTKTAQEVMTEYREKYTFTGGSWYDKTPSTTATKSTLKPIETGVKGVADKVADIQSQIQEKGVRVGDETLRMSPTEGKQKEYTSGQGNKFWANIEPETDTGVVTTDELLEDENNEKVKIDKNYADQEKEEQREIDSLSRQGQIKNLKTELGISDSSVLPSYESDYEALRSEQGVGAVEGQLNTLNKTIADKEASLREGMYNVEGKLKPMELIGTEQRELARQGQEAMDELTRRKATLVDELNTKYSLIETTMNLRKMDYEAARGRYESDFNLQLKLLDIVEGREDKEENLALSAAKANWATMTSMIASGLKDGSILSYDGLSDEIKTNIRKMEIAQGLPAGFTSQVMNNVDKEKTIKSVITSSDKTQATYLYDDGTSQVFNTGLTAEGDEIDKEASYKAGLLTEKDGGMPYEDAIRDYGSVLDLDYIDRLYGRGKYIGVKADEDFYAKIDDWDKKVSENPDKYYRVETSTGVQYKQKNVFWDTVQFEYDFE